MSVHLCHKLYSIPLLTNLSTGDGDGNRPCSNCKKSDSYCVRTSKRIRFKNGSRTKDDLEFSSDQTWLQTSRQHISFVDETPDTQVATATVTSSPNARRNSARDIPTNSSPQFSPLATHSSAPLYQSPTSAILSPTVVSDASYQHSNSRSSNHGSNIQESIVNDSAVNERVGEHLSPTIVMGTTPSSTYAPDAGTIMTPIRLTLLTLC